MNDQEMEKIIDDHWNKLKSVCFSMVLTVPFYAFVAWAAQLAVKTQK